MHITSSSRLGNPVTVELHITRAYFTVTFSTGEVLRLEPQDLGPILLRKLRQRPSDLPLSPTPSKPLSQYNKVCACGQVPEPFTPRCPDCPGVAGQGKLPKPSHAKCLACDGSGQIEARTVGNLPRLAKCQACEGTGFQPKQFTASGRRVRPTLASLGKLQLQGS